MQKHVFLIAALAALSGCASDLIDVRPGSDKIVQVESAKVAQCRKVGQTTVGVLDHVAFYSRSIDAIDENLSQLARNSALDMGGDTVVPGERLDVGKRVFAVYKCAPAQPAEPNKP
jgi:hypothetical protein